MVTHALNLKKKKKKERKKEHELGIVAQASNPSTQEAQAVGLCEFKAAWSTDLHSFSIADSLASAM